MPRPNNLEANAAKPPKTVGVYAADLVPGAYIQTRSGAVRGEELFSRPDLERPWRSVESQKRATTIALKEKEIEELMRLTSKLRTELGNAKSDARFVEYAVTEKAKGSLNEKDKTIAELEERLAKSQKQVSETKEATECQIRLLKAQHENEVVNLKNEARLAGEKCSTLADTYLKQIEDLKAASVREIKFVETLFTARVDELNAELGALRASKDASEKHYREQTTSADTLVHRVECDYKERLRASEQRVEELRELKEKELQNVRAEKDQVNDEYRRALEKMALSAADRDDVLNRFKLWSRFVLAGLDDFYNRFTDALPQSAVEPADPQLVQLPFIYAPQTILADTEAKVTVERVVYRLLQLKQTINFGGAASVPSGREHVKELQLVELQEKQTRLKTAIREVETKIEETNSTISSILGRLYFFSDDLEQATQTHAVEVAPPLKDVVFVCLTIPAGDAIWEEDRETMRTAMTLLNSTMRLKMSEYGAYECYTDAVSMLLAFDDAAAACRFCTESQVWLLSVPWPSALLRKRQCAEQFDREHNLVFRGLRVAMAMHAGEAFIEPTAIPLSGTFRAHYYGRAVSQLIHVCSLAQGGQILATEPAWGLCLKSHYELGNAAATELGIFSILSFHNERSALEKQMIKLFEIAPPRLKTRVFDAAPATRGPSVSSLARVKKAVVSAEIEALCSSREAMKEAIRLLNEEFSSVRSDITAMLSRARTTHAHFHLLPPPEMVEQMNDLYGVMEKIAVRAEDLRGELCDLGDANESLGLQAKGLQEYLNQQAATGSREDELRVEMEVAMDQMEQKTHALTRKHYAEIGQLQKSLKEQEQTIRNLQQHTVRQAGAQKLQFPYFSVSPVHRSAELHKHE